MSTENTDPAAERIDKLERAIRAILRAIGDPGTCRGCNAPITWIRHKNDRAVPYDADGTNHFVTCPEAARFRRRRETV